MSNLDKVLAADDISANTDRSLSDNTIRHIIHPNSKCTIGTAKSKGKSEMERAAIATPVSVRDIKPTCQGILEELGYGHEPTDIPDNSPTDSDTQVDREQIQTNQQIQAEEKKTRCSKVCSCVSRFESLPHWCVYIAWLLVVVSTVVPAFFCLLYSLEWGSQKSEAWLTCMFIGFLQSVLIVQPLKVRNC